MIKNGARCPECGGETEVVAVKHYDSFIKRWRRCLHCFHAFTTAQPPEVTTHSHNRHEITESHCGAHT